ncbi:hypothetical protein GOP47_0013259 [Adiantum capillus-veneris]|uniref:Jacalin-type lectin domain-containing protein n=1 Tax=Adiantum capillus-veneris TaxID=13818 RepID=A0A9D4UN58_ADICA|nr:hypothetical protein GOP47_0013259 [Adiantum capillus-veneris]
MATSSAVKAGPWGGDGGDAFDDGWDNGGVSKLTIYYQPSLLSDIHVAYGNGTTMHHGGTLGIKKEVIFMDFIYLYDH